MGHMSRFATACVLAWTGIAILVSGSSWAYKAPVATVESLTVALDGPAEISEPSTPFAMWLRLSNAGAKTVNGTARLAGVDGWMTAPLHSPFSVAPESETVLEFQVMPAPGAYHAHYPVHAYVAIDGAPQPAHLVMVIATRWPNPAPQVPSVEWRPFDASSRAATPLWRLPAFRVFLSPSEGGNPYVMEPGWAGSDATSGATAHPSSVDRQGIREGIMMHPPWRDRKFRSVVYEMPIRLPEASSLCLTFGAAIRDHHPEQGEPPSDGVTFRVRVAPEDALPGRLGDVVFEAHTATKQWTDYEANLAEFSGRTVRLQLESDPGPAGDVTCDACYWGAPTLKANTSESFDAGATALQPTLSLGVIGNDRTPYEVSVTPGARGLLDAAIQFASALHTLEFTGFHIRVGGDVLSDVTSLARLVGVTDESAGGVTRFRHAFETGTRRFDVVADLFLTSSALKARFRLENASSPKPWRATYLEGIAAGPWMAPVVRVYAGTGNVLDYPEPFILECDGHRLSTSFVGFEFEKGGALVQGVDLPPDRLEVDPGRRLASLHVAHDATMSFIPTSDVWRGARLWHDTNGLQVADGVRKLAGRFVFDLWGGRYDRSREALERAFHYGLTDAVVVWHNWQRWGYDNRLPDIFPPNPDFGSMDDFNALVDTCRRHGVLFAPHDNYIDLYPDSEGFTYDHVAFDQHGQPVRGWFNAGIQAQAYRWRPDRLDEAMDRNLRLIKDALSPTAYFIDVWSSIQPHDYWTRDGRFFDRVYTRNRWGERFAWIRDLLGGSAPQISESGHDQLIGWLDGAQTNHLRVWRPCEPDPQWAAWRIGAVDAERIPWFDAAHHDRFVLHGAGYEPRYTAGLDSRLHGMYSDDYISTEVLTGHPPMVSAAFGRDVVRKYWLLHDIMAALALRRMEDFAFMDSIHRQHVRWENEGEVWVNRGASDWTIEGHILPPYGFYARVHGPEGVYQAAVERQNGAIVEWSSGPHRLYANARPQVTKPVAVSTPGDPVSPTGGRTFNLAIDWSVRRPLTKDVRPFIHFMRGDTIAFQGDYIPDTPVEQWRGDVHHTIPITLPTRARPGDTFEVRVGLFEPGDGRVLIDGWDDGYRGIRLGTLRVEGSDDSVSGVSWIPMPEDPAKARSNQPGATASVGPVTTPGGCLIENRLDGLWLTPLPDSEPFDVSLSWKDLPWALPQPLRVEALDQMDNVMRELPLHTTLPTLNVTCAAEEFAYRIAVAER